MACVTNPIRIKGRPRPYSFTRRSRRERGYTRSIPGILGGKGVAKRRIKGKGSWYAPEFVRRELRQRGLFDLPTPAEYNAQAGG